MSFGKKQNKKVSSGFQIMLQPHHEQNYWILSYRMIPFMERLSINETRNSAFIVLHIHPYILFILEILV